MNAKLSKDQIVTARIIGGVADFIQIVLAPFFIEGAISPFNDALDILVGFILCCVIGFHWAFIPTFIIEEVPVMDDLPTWTLAVLYATHGRQALPQSRAITK